MNWPNQRGRKFGLIQLASGSRGVLILVVSFKCLPSSEAWFASLGSESCGDMEDWCAATKILQS